ncbi:MAG: single-stranded DNA-binding protein [Planctomycetaceae bacterium]
MANFNRVILLGNLTRDPQVRYTPGGTAVADIGLAVNRTWFDKQTNTKNQETTFVDVTLWSRQAEVAGEYLSKGSSVLIEGRLHLDQWDDKETGKKRSKLKVICENMTMVGGRSEGGGGAGRKPQPDSGQDAGQGSAPAEDAYYDSAPMEAPDDDVPF